MSEAIFMQAGWQDRTTFGAFSVRPHATLPLTVRYRGAANAKSAYTGSLAYAMWVMRRCGLPVSEAQLVHHLDDQVRAGELCACHHNATLVGDLPIVATTAAGKRIEFTITNVRFVPAFQYTLLSVAQRYFEKTDLGDQKTKDGICETCVACPAGPPGAALAPIEATPETYVFVAPSLCTWLVSYV